ncbi:MAG: aldo/keto reductase [Phycisphaerae bacterium]|jgi:L-glyceraldehyde 3-phosphate reductase
MYEANKERYGDFSYNRAGRSGLCLPPISLGFWHNFGTEDDYANCRKMVLTAFDSGITHFDLANNYGPPEGSAEEVFGRILREDLGRYRDELVISTKAGHLMWPGPYGDGGSRKYLLSSLDASLKRLGLDYVDIFYTHRRDTETPIEETLRAVSDAVKSGRALYTSISKYNPDDTITACDFLEDAGTPMLLHQVRYSMLERTPETGGLWDALRSRSKAAIIFSPLAQGLLTSKYLSGIPAGSRASKEGTFLKAEQITDKLLGTISQLNALAAERGQSLAQFALQWALRDDCVCSAIIGASRPEQITDCLKAVSAPAITNEELEKVEAILA